MNSDCSTSFCGVCDTFGRSSHNAQADKIIAAKLIMSGEYFNHPRGRLRRGMGIDWTERDVERRRFKFELEVSGDWHLYHRVCDRDRRNA